MVSFSHPNRKFLPLQESYTVRDCYKGVANPIQLF